MIVVVVILAILSSIAVLKFSSNFEQASILKIKSDLISIKTSLESAKNFNVISTNNLLYPSSLDNCIALDEDCLLFTGISDFEILQKGIVPCKNSIKTQGCWEKISNIKYLAWINDSKSIAFDYVVSSGSFGCNENNSICKEIMK